MYGRQIAKPQPKPQPRYEPIEEYTSLNDTIERMLQDDYFIDQLLARLEEESWIYSRHLWRRAVAAWAYVFIVQLVIAGVFFMIVWLAFR